MSKPKQYASKRTNSNKTWRRLTETSNQYPTLALVRQTLTKLLLDIESQKYKIAQKEQLIKDMSSLSQGLRFLSIREEDVDVLM